MNALAAPSYIAAAIFWLLTGAYAMLTSQDFIYEQFLQPELLPPLAAFARHWALGSAGVLALWLLPRTVELRRPDIATILVAIVWTGASAAAWFWPLSSLSPGPFPLAVMVGSMLVMVTLALAEHPAMYDATPESRPNTARDFFACALAGLCVAAIDSAVRVASPGSAAGDWAVLGASALTSVRLHLLVAMLAFLVLTALRAAAGFLSRQVPAEAILTVTAIGVLLGWFLHSLVLASISVTGAWAAAGAYFAGLALAFALTARALTRFETPDDGVASVVGSVAPAWTQTTTGFLIWLVVAMGVAMGVDAASRLGDWNFVFARLGVLVVWLLVLGGARRFVSMPGAGEPAVFFGLALIVLGGHVSVERYGPAATSPQALAPGARWITDLLTARSDGPSDLYALLQAHTNIPGSRGVAPVRIDWAPLAGEPSADRPHVFVFVVDSLRRDYLSPYNPKVTFSPAMAAFADDSFVFRQAFTQYGATGLSVPSIWIGGLPLHKQYVTPFAPMNALARLLTHEQYAQWVSMDNILDVILPVTPALEPLDQGVPVRNFRMCQTLDEIRARLRDRDENGPPVFAYSLPQDIHVSTITREGGNAVDDENYDGFFAPVASRVRRFDACFGAFIEELKSLELYDRSVIVVTSDHGDSLGEGGRMGHAYTLYPEVARVPLIVHVPAAMRGRLTWDVARPAYTTDLTPTLYQLLGHDPVSPGAHFGLSLGRLQGNPAPPPRDRMIAASYGSVYGALMNGATSMYVVDAIQRREMAFTLGDGAEPGSPTPVTAAMRVQAAAVIRQTVESIARSYGYTPPGR